MTTDKNQKLIEELAADIRPVKPVRFSALFVAWLALSLVASALTLTFLGVRADLWEQLQSFSFWSQFLLFLAGAIVCVLMTFRLAVPGLEGSAKKRWFVFSLLVLYTGFHLVSLTNFDFSQMSHHLTHGYACTTSVIVGALLPFAVINILLFKLLPLRSFLVAMYASFAAFWMGSFVSNLHCMNDNGFHLLLWHFLPVLVIGLIVAVPLASVLKKRL